MRSLGLKKNEVIFIYLAEAVILIFCASLIGTIIGGTIAYTMSLQWEMFMYIKS